MPTKTEYTPGTPSWVDLATTDPTAARDFYGALFGWTFDEQPTDGGGAPYTLAFLNGQVAAGLMAQTPEMRDAGAPPMWSTYVTVADADATTGKVEAAGGSVFSPAFDVMDAGRMSVIADPTGAVLCTWQPKNHPGAAVVNEPGAFSWNELLTPDVDRAAAFYRDLFGWTARTQSMGPMTYTEFLLGEASIAGAQPPPMEGIPPVWTVYFTVANTDQTLENATGRGAQVLVPATDIPPGRFAVLTDPHGAAFNIIQPPG
jgi:predicted enzyme related to lactoylglutathione lyase